MKIKCPLCETENEEDARFCKECNIPLYDLKKEEEEIKEKIRRKKMEEEERIRAEANAKIEEERKRKERDEFKKVEKEREREENEFISPLMPISEKVEKKEKKYLMTGLVIFAIVFIIFMILDNGKKEIQPIKKEIDQQSVEYSIGYKLCVIDGDYEKEDSVKVRRYNYLLESLAQRCSCEEINIADMSVAAQQILREKYGKEVKIITLLEAANEDLAYGCSKDDFAKYMTLTIQFLK